MHHTFLILGFFKGKLAKNEPNYAIFKFAQNSPENDIHVKQVSLPPFLGIVGDKKWSLFSNLNDFIIWWSSYTKM